MKTPAVYLLSFLLFLASCSEDDEIPVVIQSTLDDDLIAVMENAANGSGLEFFQLPGSDDFANIPADPNNPLTAEKVALGKLLYHETALGMNPRTEERLWQRGNLFMRLLPPCGCRIPVRTEARY